jgi:hypothetical protein
VAFADGQDAKSPEDPGKGLPRTLEDINIEGDIPVPQVLFITARDQRRILSFNHDHYLKTSLQIGRGTVYPRWIALTRKSPMDARKEITP